MYKVNDVRLHTGGGERIHYNIYMYKGAMCSDTVSERRAIWHGSGT